MKLRVFGILPLLLNFGSTQIDRLHLKFRRHPDSFLNLAQVIRKYGYPLEVHKVVTEDGYILRTHRIPYGIAQPQQRSNRSAVLILHGMGGTPDHLTVLGPGRGLPYYLADNGFDVWLMNARGGWYSDAHVKYDWDRDQQFWNFSWHHIGIYDISANVEYVIKKTGQKKVFFIGHSSGGTSYFALTSDRPEITGKIKIAVGLATSTFMKYVDAPVMKPFAATLPIMQALTDYLGLEEPPAAPGANKLLNMIFKVMCSETTIFADVCIGVMSTIASHESVIFDKSLIDLIVSSMPARVSIKQCFHFGQLVNSGRFANYDFGPTKNRIIYGTDDPPDYNVSNSKAPVALFYGPRDFLAHPRGVLDLGSRLPNLILAQAVPLSDFNHLDFLFGTNTTELVYEPIVKLFKDYDNGILPPRVKITDF